ncbi:MAG TPA: methyltransferase domain-containing protein [Candidatus Saccharimonadales bacterium]|nr:methyltransferase domain-containing protein [Candidatus Saccharimonadales bacterium]
MTDLTKEEKITKRSYDQNAHQWSENHSHRGYWRRQIVKFHELLPSGEIIEIGCGGGRDARELVELGYKYTGTDISPELLKEARKNVPGQKFYEQSLYELSFPKKFDGFWACAVLLHIPKSRISEALNSIKSVLKPQAIGFISIKNGQGEDLYGNEKIKRFFSFWKKEDFEQVLKTNGFEIIDYIHDPRSPTDDWMCFFVKLTGEILMAKEKLFQIGVKALIANDEGQVLVLNSGEWHLKNQTSHWDIPGGRIQEGHSVLETLQREVEEETGVKKILSSDFFSATISNFEYEVDGHKIGLALMIYKVEIPVDSRIVLSEEHSDYEWIDKKEAAKRLAYKYPSEFTKKLL